MTVEAVVDRVEGSTAVLEIAGTHVDWPLNALPPGTREGTKLCFTVDATEASQSELADAQARLERLRSTGPSGDDIEL